MALRAPCGWVVSFEQLHLCYQRFGRASAHAFCQLSAADGTRESMFTIQALVEPQKLELALFVSALTDASVDDSGLP